MAGGKTAYLKDALINGVLGGAQFTLPTTVYIALSTAAFTSAATGSSMSEVGSGGYSRVAVTNNGTNWTASTGGAGLKQNATPITFPTATGSQGTAVSFYICDAASNGNALYGGDLNSSRAILTGDTPSFAANQLTVTES